MLSRTFARDLRWRPLAPAARTLALLSVAALVFAVMALAAELSASEGGFFGLAERIFIVVTLSWLLLVSIGCIRRGAETV